MKVYEDAPYNGIGMPNRRFSVEASVRDGAETVRAAVRKAAGRKKLCGCSVSAIEVKKTAHPRIWDVWVWY